MRLPLSSAWIAAAILLALLAAVAPAPAATHAAPILASIANACDPPDITVTSDFEREYYEVTGTTVEDIEASLDKSGLTDSNGEKAVALTEYSIQQTGRLCEADADSCQIARIRLEVSGTITLPRISDTSKLSGALLNAWTSFARATEVHERRHATITNEAAVEIKRQLLDLGLMPCAALDSAIDRIWRLETEAMERRQTAFHVADDQGRGGQIVR